MTNVAAGILARANLLAIVLEAMRFPDVTSVRVFDIANDEDERVLVAHMEINELGTRRLVDDVGAELVTILEGGSDIVVSSRAFQGLVLDNDDAYVVAVYSEDRADPFGGCSIFLCEDEREALGLPSGVGRRAAQMEGISYDIRTYAVGREALPGVAIEPIIAHDDEGAPLIGMGRQGLQPSQQVRL